MPSSFTRYAIYYAPAYGSPLAEFGRRWFGYDPKAGTSIDQRITIGLDDAFVFDVTSQPARYGLHATLKPPIQLAIGRTEEQLAAATARLAQRLELVTTGPLEVVNLDGFLALCPSGDLTALNALAAEIVEQLDPFRAPPGAAERQRRVTANLSPRQRELLEAWGYPFLLDQFRLHITLTRRLDDGERQRLLSRLKDELAEHCTQTFVVDSICLYGDPGESRPFRYIHRFPLGAG